ncbi:MAG TPA: hypothetical protein VH280_06070 [Verrucomicrobiae bacterium]|jgi:predicted transcriptional regulator|nr:hypothetical protein [Verrucomicrobiae bacterium]
MKNKSGRPEMAEGKANNKLINFRLSGEIEEAINKAAEVSHQTKPEWMRNALLEKAKAERPFFKSKWEKGDLDEKAVEFMLTRPDCRIHGVGEFHVLKNNKDELRIDIVVKKYGPIYLTENRYHLSKEAAEQIRVHPNQETANFQLVI